jgi:hypothetical protein
MALSVGVAHPAQSQAGSIYWIGGDGNVYSKGAGGNGAQVANLGAANGTGTTANLVLNGARQVADPNSHPAAAATPAPANPNGNSGGGGKAPPAGPVYKDRSNDIAVQNAGLASSDAQTSAGLAAIQKALGGLKGQYATETAANEANYGNESDSNQNALQGGKQTALVHAGQGRQGLLGTLSSIGALSGDSIELANTAVQNGANDDLAGVNHTFATNQSGLDTSIGTYRRENKSRNDEADTSAENASTNTRNNGLQAKQSYLTNLLNDYSQQGDEATAKGYADQVAALYPQIAATNVPSSKLVAQSAAYTPASLATYLGAGNTSVTATPAPGDSPGSLPGLSAINGQRKQTTSVAAA